MQSLLFLTVAIPLLVAFFDENCKTCDIDRDAMVLFNGTDKIDVLGYTMRPVAVKTSGPFNSQFNVEARWNGDRPDFDSIEVLFKSRNIDYKVLLLESGWVHFCRHEELYDFRVCQADARKVGININENKKLVRMEIRMDNLFVVVNVTHVTVTLPEQEISGVDKGLCIDKE